MISPNWFKWWLGACSPPNYYLNQCWLLLAEHSGTKCSGLSINIQNSLSWFENIFDQHFVLPFIPRATLLTVTSTQWLVFRREIACFYTVNVYVFIFVYAIKGVSLLRTNIYFYPFELIESRFTVIIAILDVFYELSLERKQNSDD